MVQHDKSNSTLIIINTIKQKWSRSVFWSSSSSSLLGFSFRVFPKFSYLCHSCFLYKSPQTRYHYYLMKNKTINSLLLYLTTFTMCCKFRDKYFPLRIIHPSIMNKNHPRTWVIYLLGFPTHFAIDFTIVTCALFISRFGLYFLPLWHS